MSFMRPFISDTPSNWLLDLGGDSDPVEVTLPPGLYDREDETPPNGVHPAMVARLCDSNDVDAFEVRGPLYHGYLLAPGYLDRTPYSFGSTRAEVARDLLRLWYDDDDDDAEDEDQANDIRELEEIARCTT